MGSSDAAARKRVRSRDGAVESLAAARQGARAVLGSRIAQGGDLIWMILLVYLARTESVRVLDPLVACPRSASRWLAEANIDTAHIDPGKPWQNGSNESFNGKFRDECLSLQWFKN